MSPTTNEPQPVVVVRAPEPLWSKACSCLVTIVLLVTAVCVLGFIHYYQTSRSRTEVPPAQETPAEPSPSSVPTDYPPASAPSPQSPPPPNVVYYDTYVVYSAFDPDRFALSSQRGNVFVAWMADIANRGSSVVSVNQLDFTLFLDGVLYTRSASASMALRPGVPQLQAVSLAPGGRCWGVIAFECPDLPYNRAALLWQPAVLYGPSVTTKVQFKGKWQFP